MQNLHNYRGIIEKCLFFFTTTFSNNIREQQCILIRLAEDY